MSSELRESMFLGNVAIYIPKWYRIPRLATRIRTLAKSLPAGNVLYGYVSHRNGMAGKERYRAGTREEGNQEDEKLQEVL